MNSIVEPLIGGVIIGIATSLMLFFNGKITGISGICANAFTSLNKKDFWRISFLLGLIVGAIFMKFFFPNFFNYELNFSYIEMVIAGLLVGFGTQLGSGCTSGHGVCGLPRLSARSLVATLTFISFGILTVLVRGL